jgi:hypothetical protein
MWRDSNENAKHGAPLNNVLQISLQCATEEAIAVIDFWGIEVFNRGCKISTRSISTLMY